MNDQPVPTPSFEDLFAQADAETEVLLAVSRFLATHADESQGAPLTAPGLPEGWTVRDEANVLAASAFRNTYLEELHAGPSGFSDEEMRKLMIEASARLAELAYLRQAAPDLYAAFLVAYGSQYCRRWDRDATRVELKRRYLGPCPRCKKSVRITENFCPSCGKLLGR